MDWFRGRVYIEPEIEYREREVFGNQRYTTKVVFRITPGGLLISPKSLKPSPEIQESLVRFREDHPYPDRVAFVMMRFGATPAHDAIVRAISEGLNRFGISAVRADEKEYHDHLFPNVLTYVYGCGFGIAVFERIEEQQFNPNVALELGYMLALGKPVCLLKDRTLTALHTDLVGHLYKVFDPLHPQTKIPEALERWLTDRGLVRKD
jgi:hypothetical protein